VSKCGRATVVDTVTFYKQLGYDGIFITNHFLDGNINPEARVLPYCEQIDYYFSDYEEGARIGNEIGLKEKGLRPEIAGMCCDTKLESVHDYITSVQDGTIHLFLMNEDKEVSLLGGT
jgi:hypothetical protein